MGTWTTKFRKPALIAGLLAISIAANTAYAKKPDDGSKRGGAAFTSGAIIGGAAAGPIGAVVGASLGAVMGERSHKKSQALAARRAEAALLASEVDTLNSSLTSIESKAGEVGSNVQFRTGQTAVRDNDRARIAKLGALVAGLKDVRVAGTVFEGQPHMLPKSAPSSIASLAQVHADTQALNKGAARASLYKMVAAACCGVVDRCDIARQWGAWINDSRRGLAAIR